MNIGLSASLQICRISYELRSKLQNCRISYELRSKLTHIPSLDNFDLDENYVQAINSKYYDLPEFSKLYSSLSGKTFSLFHVNTRSLSKNFDQLQNVLSAAKIDFDLIGITETKQQVDKDFLVNVNITGYHMYTQPSKSNAGGVAIYIKNNLDHFIRDDLCKLDDCFEAVWIEKKIVKVRTLSVAVYIDTPTLMLLI